MSLLTGDHIYRYQRTELPVGNNILDRVDQLVLDEAQPLVATNFRYEWWLGQDIVHEDEVDVTDIKEDGQVPVNDIEDQDKVPLLPMVIRRR